MTNHARTCPGNHSDHPLRLRLGAGVPDNLKPTLVSEARAALARALGTQVEVPDEELEVPPCAAAEVAAAIDRFLQTGHQNHLGVQRRQDVLFVGDATPDLPEPAPGRYY